MHATTETCDPIAFIFSTISFIFARLLAVSDLKKKKKNLCGMRVQPHPGCTPCPKRVRHWYGYHVVAPMLSCSKDSDLSQKKRLFQRDSV